MPKSNPPLLKLHSVFKFGLYPIRFGTARLAEDKRYELFRDLSDKDLKFIMEAATCVLGNWEFIISS